jgi:hypothetical protein
VPVPVPMTAKCWEFPTRTRSKFRAVYDRNYVRNGVTWYEAPESRSQLVASSVVSRTSTSVVLLHIEDVRIILRSNSGYAT